nr:T9SS type A sorting domain-containing protein [Bacteroidota bacterium]
MKKKITFTIGCLILMLASNLQSQHPSSLEKGSRLQKQKLSDHLSLSKPGLYGSSKDFKTFNDYNGSMDFGNAPSWDWAEQFGGSAADSAYGFVIGMDTDHAGNFYTYGYASSEMDYFGVTIQKGTFLCKQKPSGELIWMKTFTDLFAGYHLGNYITIDPANENIYIAGVFQEAFNIPDGHELVPAENGSIFIIKFGIEGNYISVIQEDIEFSNILCLAADHSGNILLSGTFSDEALISGELLVGSGMDDAYIAKYNSSMNLNWAIKAGGTDQEYLGLISVDDNDNIYFTGEFYSVNVEIGNISLMMNEGEGNIVVAKLFPNGTADWATSKAASTADGGWGDYNCWPTGILSDLQGYTYIKGWHGDSTYFDDYMLRSPYCNNSYFIAKFDNNGNTIWVNSIQEHISGFDYNQFDYDSQGNVYLGAHARDTLHFGDDFELINSGLSDLFVAKYLANGDLDWVKILESITGNNWISSVSVCDTNLYIGGHFCDYIRFDDEVKLSDIKHGFIAMSSNNHLGFKEVYNRYGMFSNIYPNPFSNKTNIEFPNPTHSSYTLSIFSISGIKVFEMDNIQSDKIEFERGNLPEGVYLLELKGEKVFRGKIVVK